MQGIPRVSPWETYVKFFPEINPVNYYEFYQFIPWYIHVYDGLSNCLLLVWLINGNSLRAASCLIFKILNYDYDLSK